MQKIRLLIVDDSVVIRNVLASYLTKYEDIEIVGKANDPYEARDLIVKLKPDVITLDIEMPKMNGLEFISILKKHYPLPIIVISSHISGKCETSLSALEMGAVDVFPKPNFRDSDKLPLLMGELYRKIVAASQSKIKKMSRIVDKKAAKLDSKINLSEKNIENRVIAIGSSTGGTQAITEILPYFPSNTPPIIISQHMPAGFTAAFANRLNKLYDNLEIREAVDGDSLYPGLVLIAPGNFHLLLEKDSSGYKVRVVNGPKVCRQRPSVEVMFTSVANVAAKKSIAVLLTGMGKDGAKGMLLMKQKGAKTIAQSENTCVVYGMPREAVLLDAADYVVDLEKIPNKIIQILKESS